MTRLHTQSCLGQTSAAIPARCVDMKLHDILCWIWRWSSTCATYWQCVSKRRTLVSVKSLVCAVISGLFRGAVVISSSFNLRKFWTTCSQCVRAFFGKWMLLPNIFIVTSNSCKYTSCGRNCLMEFLSTLNRKKTRGLFTTASCVYINKRVPMYRQFVEWSRPHMTCMCLCTNITFL